MRLSILVTLLVALPAAAQQSEVPPLPEQGDLICVDAAPPILPPPAAELAARLAAFEMPRNLSVAQYQRLQQTERHFRAGRERQGLQHFAQAVTAAAVAVGPANLSELDIEALCFIVLMEAAKSAQEDLRAIMAEVKAINEAKQTQRELLTTMQDIRDDGCGPDEGESDDGDAEYEDGDDDPCASRLQALSNRIDEIRDQLDSLNEAGEVQQLRLQIIMERRAKAYETLSNLLKKMSDTASTIVANLK